MAPPIIPPPLCPLAQVSKYDSTSLLLRDSDDTRWANVHINKNNTTPENIYLNLLLSKEETIKSINSPTGKTYAIAPNNPNSAYFIQPPTLPNTSKLHSSKISAKNKPRIMAAVRLSPLLLLISDCFSAAIFEVFDEALADAACFLLRLLSICFLLYFVVVFDFEVDFPDAKCALHNSSFISLLEVLVYYFFRLSSTVSGVTFGFSVLYYLALHMRFYTNAYFIIAFSA